MKHFEVEHIRTLIPFNAIPDAQLAFLLEGIEPQYLFSGRRRDLCASDTNDYFLLYGDLELAFSNGERRMVSGRDSLYPLAYQETGLQSLKALSDCELLVLPAQDLKNQLCWSQMAEFQRLQFAMNPDLDEDAQWIDAVLDSNLFLKVPPTNVGDIFKKMRTLLVNHGDDIVQQGEVGDGCYFIKEGTAQVWVKKHGTELNCVAEIGPGRCFGEDALVSSLPRNATVRMSSDGVLVKLDKNDFLPLLQAPQVEHLSCSECLSILKQAFTCDTSAQMEPHSEEDKASEKTPLKETKIIDTTTINTTTTDTTKKSTANCTMPTVIVDVRTSDEYRFGHLKGAVNIPLSMLALQLRRLHKNQRYILYSDHGFRSDAAACVLSRLGYQVVSIKGGLKALRGGQKNIDQGLLALSDAPYVLRDYKVILGY
ncbi:cyclic nucleotide-binding domain-containing protein [Marinibactrum halimedae]|uniref:Cyclic nucleotide-binding domain-containing protein n=1 Tax=Marinibactrum halimedae TaxID=1444977 RepID=A0AA37T9G0_9GAMM|nr:cyclic nucleotide-binding domain-containing protein [Marinibactrum halimedae]MCD9459502.1 cyclic nucleotide-binding domain-containing protein [Marinibactrum halimedae]GLS28156.1 hypothetical protein GCM10007877_38750 [Marinibactrum halimedae]